MRSSIAINLLHHCSPVFEGLKSAVLIMVNNNELKEFTNIETIQILNKNGFEIKLMGTCSLYTRVLVFNRKSLEQAIFKPERFEILQSFGYSKTSLDQMLNKLKNRLGFPCSNFPHEIGIFLGYPTHDIEGFIANSGKNYLFSGYWKVYKDRNTAKKIFESYKQSRERNIQKFNRGFSFNDILK